MHLLSATMSPLLMAAFIGHEKAFSIAISSGEWDSHTVNSCLVIASSMGHFSIVRKLLSSATFPAKTQNRALTYALLQDQTACARMLLRMFPDVVVNKEDLFLLIELDRVDCLAICLQYTAVETILNMQNFQAACLSCSFRVVNWMIDLLYEDARWQPHPNMLLCVLYVRQFHFYVPELLKICGVNERANAYVREFSFRHSNPTCALWITRAVLARRWRMLRAAVRMITFWNRWISEYYVPGPGQGFSRAQESFYTKV
jgi:hypothetical protein